MARSRPSRMRPVSGSKAPDSRHMPVSRSSQVRSRLARRWRSRRLRPSSASMRATSRRTITANSSGEDRRRHRSQVFGPRGEPFTLRGVQGPDGSAEDVEVFAAYQAVVEGFGELGHRLGGLVAVEDAPGVALGGACRFGDGLFGEHGHLGELGGHRGFATVDPTPQTSKVGEATVEVLPIAAVMPDRVHLAHQPDQLRQLHTNKCSTRVSHGSPGVTPRGRARPGQRRSRSLARRR
jgi:hypothetical protein